MSTIDKDDLAALKAELKGVTPIAPDDRADVRRNAKADKLRIEARRKAAVTDRMHDANFLTTTEPAQIDPYAELSFKRDGIQTQVFKDLRQGLIEARYVLDLHHHTVENARSAVYDFILDAHHRKERCVLILHGRGAKARTPALLKRYINMWLPQFEQVLAFQSAQKRDGGTGAVYVLLKMNCAQDSDLNER